MKLHDSAQIDVSGRSPARGTWSAALSASPAILIVAFCSVLPLTWMAIVVVANPASRAEFSLDAFRLHLLARTLGYNAAAGILATAMGLPAGIVLGRGRGMLAKILWVVLPAALLMPSLSYAYGWSQCVRIVQPALRWLGDHEFHTPAIALLHLRSAAFHLPIHITFHPGGLADVCRCIGTLASWLWAAPAGLIGLSLRRMDVAVQQQALLDGALRRVTLRQLAGPIVASIAIVTVLATQEFAVYEPTGISVVATEVRMVFDTGAVSSPSNSIAAVSSSAAGARSPDQPARAAAAFATAMPLLFVTVILAVIAAWGASRASGSDTLSTGDWPPALDASRGATVFTLLLVLVNLGIPLASLIGSLHGAISPKNMWAEFGPQAGGALEVAAWAAGVAILAALSLSTRWMKGSLALAGVSFLIGGQLLAITLIRIYNRPTLAWAYGSGVVPVMAYVGRFGWLAIAAGRSTWSRPWRELRDVAAVDGATPWQVAVSVIWPLAWPTLLAGGLIVGALAVTEVPATVLLMPMNPQVLTPTLMTWVHMSRFDPMIEASLLMMTMVLFPALGATLLIALGLRIRNREGTEERRGNVPS